MEVTINDLKEILANTYFGKNSKLLDKNDLLREQGVDSLDLLDFYLKIEERYNIEIDDEDVAGLLTLKDYKDYVSERLKDS